jgi:hypothetical protein
LSIALLLQLGFQTETVMGQWLSTPPYKSTDFRHAFRHGPESINYVTSQPKRQGEFITPTRGVVDCYNEDEFIKADIDIGDQLVRRQLRDGVSIPLQASTHAKFVTWSHIRLRLDNNSPALEMSNANSATHLQMVLNQAFHPLWQADECQINRTVRGNLVVDCPLSRWRAGTVDLKFNDELSTRAAAISTKAWRLWMPVMGGLMLLSYFGWRRKPATR